MGSKGVAALAQLYAIFVITRMHTQDDAAIIFILLGYTIWFQVFELGLAQTLQNKFNAKLISSSDMLRALMAQFLIVLVIGLIVLETPLLADLLLPDNRQDLGGEATAAFSLGAAILLIASNNVITQRLLLVLNRGRIANILIMVQSVLAIVGLAVYDFIDKPNLKIAVILYLGPQILVYTPVWVRLMWRVAWKSAHSQKTSTASIFIDSLGFWGLGILSVFYLGLDYYFVAHYLSPEQVVSYHLVTRVFFVSYVAYYAFLQYHARHLSILSRNSGRLAIASFFKESAAVGIGSVSVVFCFALVLEGLGGFSSITNGVGLNIKLLFFAFLYFTVRSCRDVTLVIASGLDARHLLYIVYSIELAVGLSLLSVLVPIFGDAGIFLSMSLASIVGLVPLLLHARRLEH